MALGISEPGGSTPIRDAATVIVLRDAGGPAPSVLMGQRGKSAAFMPGKFVFPGGAVDRADAAVTPARELPALCATRLTEQNSGPAPQTIAASAIRELWEETGQILGHPAAWSDPPEGWETFGAQGFRPDASALTFVFRAITPPGRPRRFDARFFLADAGALATDPDDFTRASDELSHLQWVPLRDARGFDLPFVTEVVLAELIARLPDLGPPASVPFFHNGAEEAAFIRLGGRAI